jgi:hypothetical protein
MTSATEGYRLSTQQRHVWGLLVDGRCAGYVAWCAARLHGRWDGERLRAALERLVARHEILRTTYRRPSGVDVPLQVISDRPEVGFETHDLRTLPAGDQQRRYAQLRAEWPGRLLDMEEGPVVSAALLLVGDGHDDAAHLLLRLPAMCADERSLHLLLEELIGPSAAAEEPLQYADFAQWQHGILTDREFEIEREYWLSQDPAGLLGPELPMVRRDSTPRPIESAVLHHPVPAVLRTELRGLAGQLGVDPSTVVLAGWRLLLDRMVGDTAFSVGVRFDNRRAEELLTAVGAYAKYLPVAVRSRRDETLAEFARRLQGELDRMGEVQEYFGWEHVEPRLPRTPSGARLTAGFDWNDSGPPRGYEVDEADAVSEGFHVRVRGL